jgi:hypothetical protein
MTAVPPSHAIQIGYGPPEVMEWQAAAVAGGPGHAGLSLPAAANSGQRQLQVAGTQDSNQEDPQMGAGMQDT